MKDNPTPLTPDMLLGAYASGIFPMAEGRDDPDIFWVEPRMRGILPLDRFHISRSLARRIRAGGFEVSLDTAFDEVVAACADREETWISFEIAQLYSALHARGDAHSLEIRQDGLLIGGVYGVALGAAFFGESMFSRRSDGSKLALAYLTHHLRACGFTLFDTQFITPHLERLGAIEVPRAHYQQLLSEALAQTASIHDAVLSGTAHSILQDRTQTS
jgi:leucyl/phenylalanyl-tRNA--protein transferase